MFWKKEVTFPISFIVISFKIHRLIQHFACIDDLFFSRIRSFFGSRRHETSILSLSDILS